MIHVKGFHPITSYNCFDEEASATTTKKFEQNKKFSEQTCVRDVRKIGKKQMMSSIKVKSQSNEPGRQGKCPFPRITHDTCHFYVGL